MIVPTESNIIIMDKNEFWCRTLALII